MVELVAAILADYNFIVDIVNDNTIWVCRDDFGVTVYLYPDCIMVFGFNVSGNERVEYMDVGRIVEVVVGLMKLPHVTFHSRAC